jgi:hypothetical protein
VVEDHSPPLEAFILHVRREQFLKLLDIPKLLSLHITPEFLQICLAISVGDVLVVPPHAVEPPAQFVNHVMIVILASLRLSDMLVFRLDLSGHVTILFP